MALWLVRAGKYGEHEARSLSDDRVYLTWDELTETNLSTAADYEGIKGILQQKYPNEPTRRVANWAGQIWAFVLGIKASDLVVMPSKFSPTIAVGEVLSLYEFDATSEPMYRHFRRVKWLTTAAPRSAFDQDLLYSMGAFLTVCEIKRNDAEKRVRAMAATGWTAPPAIQQPVVVQVAVDGEAGGEQVEVDFEQLAQDSIQKLVAQRFKGHGMARLVEAVLKAQGFATFRSPEGPDKGIDILAAGGPFGFDRPRICVQVKSGDNQADRPEFTQLIGAMQSVAADQGLFVSWAGFKPTVLKELPAHFFRVRVWNASQLIEQILANYEKLDQDIKAELPLKQIWTIATPDD